jgi:glyoxylase-like metal-dependent hydrolase (beta-lactamase superfamily II)
LQPGQLEKDGTMALISEVAEKIYEIKPEGNGHEVFPLCTVYLVADEKTALIEVGSSVQIPDTLNALARLDFDIKELSYIIPTHVHSDHAGGAGHLAQQLPLARVVTHPKAAKFLADQSIIDRLLQSRKMVFGDDADERFGGMLAIAEERFVRVEDGDEIDLGKRKLEVIHTPGHDPNHLCFMDSKTRGLFCGDALGGYFSETKSRMPASVPGSDPEVIVQSIDRVQQFDPAMLFFSHGGTTADASRIIQVALKNERLCADTALKALKAGENQEVIARKLAEIVAEESDLTTEEILAFPNFTRMTVEGYRQSFKRKNLI